MRRSVVALIVVAAASSACASAPEPDFEPATSVPAPSAVGVPAPDGPDGTLAYEVASRDHTPDPVAYTAYPPFGGDHFPQWWSCGFYEERILDEAAVHTLEHGAVWITYGPGTSETDLAALRAMVDADEKLLVSPYPELAAPFVATAWGRQLELDSLDDERLVEFVAAYRAAGLAPEPAVTCGGGLTP